MALLEIACFDPESAEVASLAGADRIELCADREEAGTTPPVEWLEIVKARVSIPVFVMIRPRGGDFTYTDEEFARMLAHIGEFRSAADGYVFGILDRKDKIDVERTTRLVHAAAPLPCTFHRAFDACPDLREALEDVVATGCRAILTSGSAPSAGDGTALLRTLVQKAGARINIIIGGGVRSRNIAEIRDLTGASFFHSAALVDGGALPDGAEIRQMKRIVYAAETRFA